MTKQEFETFLRELYGALPGLKKHVYENGQDPSITQGYWLAALRDCSLGECVAAIKEIVSGSLPFEARERDTIAALIRQRVMQKRPAKGPRELPGRHRFRRKYTGSDFAVALAKLTDLQSRRSTMDDDEFEKRRRVILETVRSGDDDPTRGPSYRCLDCKDSGIVHCIHPMEFVAIKEGKSIDDPVDTCMYRCHCPAGDIFPGGESLPKFSHAGHIRVEMAWLNQQEKAAVLEKVFPSNPVINDFAAFA